MSKKRKCTLAKCWFRPCSSMSFDERAFKPIPFFGGKEGFLRQQKLDRRKARLCAENDISLIYHRYDEPITREIVETRIKKHIKLRKNHNPK